VGDDESGKTKGASGAVNKLYDNLFKLLDWLGSGIVAWAFSFLIKEILKAEAFILATIATFNMWKRNFEKILEFIAKAAEDFDITKPFESLVTFFSNVYKQLIQIRDDIAREIGEWFKNFIDDILREIQRLLGLLPEGLGPNPHDHMGPAFLFGYNFAESIARGVKSGSPLIYSALGSTFANMGYMSKKLSGMFYGSPYTGNFSGGYSQPANNTSYSRNVNVNVNANYSSWQSPGDIRNDVLTSLALTRL
jgi:hypothetical protein